MMPVALFKTHGWSDDPAVIARMASRGMVKMYVTDAYSFGRLLKCQPLADDASTKLRILRAAGLPESWSDWWNCDAVSDGVLGR